MTRRDAHLLVLFGCAAVILALSFDVLRDPAHRLFPSFSQDDHLGVFNLWWTSEAVFAGRSPFWTPLLFHPTGTTLVFTEFTPLFGLLSAPLVRVIGGVEGVVLAQNLWVILSFMLTGYATFLFADRVSGTHRGALLAGLLAAFCAFRVHHIEHLNLLSLFWMPLAGWLFAGWLLVDERARPPAWPHLGWFVLLGAGLTLTSFSIAAFTAVFLVLWLGATALLRRRAWWPEAGRRAAAAALAFALGALPLALAWLGGAGGGVAAHPDELVRWSPDVLGFFLPQGSALLGPLVEPAATCLHRPSGEEMYLSWVMIFAAVAGVSALRRAAVPLLITAFVCLVLALGPGIWLGGEYQPFPFSPYALLMRIAPVLDAVRTPNRFVVPAVFALAPLAAAGVARLCDRSRWALPLLVGLALIDLVPAPFVAVDAHVPDVFRRMAADPVPGAVIELPMLEINDLNRAAFHVVVHGRPLVGGPLIRPSAEARAEERRLDLQARLRRPDAIAGAMADLREIGVRFVVWHRHGMEPERWQAVQSLYAGYAEPWFEGPELAVFRLEPHLPRQPPPPARHQMQERHLGPEGGIDGGAALPLHRLLHDAVAPLRDRFVIDELPRVGPAGPVLVARREGEARP